MGVSGAKEVKFTTFAGRKNLIELKLIDGIPINISVGMPFLFREIKILNIIVKYVKNIQYGELIMYTSRYIMNLKKMSNMSKIFNEEFAMNIKRDKYLNDLINRMHNGLIKVVTGIRRCGKTYLIFTIFKNYLLEQGVDEKHIISIELDQRKDKKYRDPDTILDYIESSIVDEGQYYVLLDEVQLLEEFEEVLNSLLHIKNVDVYVTGSNSKFLSKDVITEFRGRGDEIHIYPLTFKEFMQVYEGDIYHGWAEYVIYGGLPLTVTMKTEEQKINYLTKLLLKHFILAKVNRRI